MLPSPQVDLARRIATEAHETAESLRIVGAPARAVPERVAHLDDSTRDRLGAKYAHALEQLGVDRSVITALHEAQLAR